MIMKKRSLRLPKLTIKTAPYIFLIPFLVFFITFRIGPIIWSLIFSFLKWDGFTSPSFEGFGNYLTIFKSPRFLKAVGTTVYIVFLYNAIMLSLAIILGILITEKGIRAKRFFRTVYFLPVATSLTVCAIVFDRVLGAQFGFVNIVIQRLGGSGDIPFLSSADWINNSIIMMKIWRGTGYYVAFMVAGMMSISPTYYEAAEIDGAGFFRKHLSVTLPSLRPIILFSATMSLILTFQTFDEPWVLTQGGPADASLTLQILLYQTSFVFNRIGQGAALSYIMTVMMVGVSLITSLLFRTKD
jgi:lactose/L-arabinose transport system permease protein